MQAVAHAATTALGSVTENPVYLSASEGHPFGRVLSTGGFHNGAAAPAINWLTASWADLAWWRSARSPPCTAPPQGFRTCSPRPLHPRGLRRSH